MRKIHTLYDIREAIRKQIKYETFAKKEFIQMK